MSDDEAFTLFLAEKLPLLRQLPLYANTEDSVLNDILDRVWKNFSDNEKKFYKYEARSFEDAFCRLTTIGSTNSEAVQVKTGEMRKVLLQSFHFLQNALDSMYCMFTGGYNQLSPTQRNYFAKKAQWEALNNITPKEYDYAALYSAIPDDDPLQCVPFLDDIDKRAYVRFDLSLKSTYTSYKPKDSYLLWFNLSDEDRDSYYQEARFCIQSIESRDAYMQFRRQFFVKPDAAKYKKNGITESQFQAKWCEVGDAVTKQCFDDAEAHLLAEEQEVARSLMYGKYYQIRQLPINVTDKKGQLKLIYNPAVLQITEDEFRKKLSRFYVYMEQMRPQLMGEGTLPKRNFQFILILIDRFNKLSAEEYQECDNIAQRIRACHQKIMESPVEYAAVVDEDMRYRRQSFANLSQWDLRMDDEYYRMTAERNKMRLLNQFPYLYDYYVWIPSNQTFDGPCAPTSYPKVPESTIQKEETTINKASPPTSKMQEIEVHLGRPVTLKEFLEITPPSETSIQKTESKEPFTFTPHVISQDHQPNTADSNTQVASDTNGSKTAPNSGRPVTLRKLFEITPLSETKQKTEFKEPLTFTPHVVKPNSNIQVASDANESRTVPNSGRSVTLRELFEQKVPSIPIKDGMHLWSLLHSTQNFVGSGYGHMHGAPDPYYSASLDYSNRSGMTHSTNQYYKQPNTDDTNKYCEPWQTCETYGDDTDAEAFQQFMNAIRSMSTLDLSDQNNFWPLFVQLSDTERDVYYNEAQNIKISKEAQLSYAFNNCTIRPTPTNTQDYIKEMYRLHRQWNNLDNTAKKNYFDNAEESLKLKAPEYGSVTDMNDLDADLKLTYSEKILTTPKNGKPFVVFMEQMRSNLLQKPGMADKHYFQQSLILEQQFSQLSGMQLEYYYYTASQIMAIHNELTNNPVLGQTLFEKEYPSTCWSWERINLNQRNYFEEKALYNRLQLMKKFPDYLQYYAWINPAKPPLKSVNKNTRNVNQPIFAQPPMCQAFVAHMERLQLEHQRKQAAHLIESKKQKEKTKIETNDKPTEQLPEVPKAADGNQPVILSEPESLSQEVQVSETVPNAKVEEKTTTEKTPTAFMFYKKAVRQQLNDKEYGKKENRSQRKKLISDWKNLGDEEKAVYFEKERLARVQHKKN